MEFEQITTDLADGVLTITLNRPERLERLHRCRWRESSTRRSIGPTPTTRFAW